LGFRPVFIPDYYRHAGKCALQICNADKYLYFRIFAEMDVPQDQLSDENDGNGEENDYGHDSERIYNQTFPG
jgi:hypothetical protein